MCKHITWIQLCQRIYTHMCTYRHTHKHTHAHTPTHIHTETHTHTQIDTYTRIHRQIHIATYTHIHTESQTQTHTHTDTHRHIHWQTHTDTYTYMHRQTDKQTDKYIDTLNICIHNVNRYIIFTFICAISCCNVASSGGGWEACSSAMCNCSVTLCSSWDSVAMFCSYSLALCPTDLCVSSEASTSCNCKCQHKQIIRHLIPGKWSSVC